jgi:hypothetical protein
MRELSAGWFGQGASPTQAALAAGADPGVDFDKAIEVYNEACRLQVDDLGRPRDSLIPLDAPPYYCMPLYIGGPYTTGGLRRDACGRVVSALGKPIDRLYSAGELGQAIGVVYPTAGAGLSESISFAQIVGETLTADEIPGSGSSDDRAADLGSSV